MYFGRLAPENVTAQNIRCRVFFLDHDVGQLPLASFSNIVGPSCETLPAPRVSTISPGWARAVTPLTAAEKDGAYLTFPAIRPASASAVTPSIGFSLAG